MQLSAANLLIASQQIARGAQQPSPEGQAKFAAELARENFSSRVAAFEPLEFAPAAGASAAVPAARAVPAATASATGYGGTSPLGANIDIRV